MPDITLEALYDAYAKMAYWAAYKVVNDRELAADAMQNAFLGAHRSMAQLSTMTEAQCRAFLYRSAVNAAIDILRRNKRSIPTEDAGVARADGAPGPEQQAEQRETQRLVREALAALPEKYREPLYLYYFAEMDYHQIAETMQLNEGTLKSRMSRGRALLEEALRKGGGEYV